ncbi:MAG: hypothetical protein HW405_750 [Candidatus Berkelbacteria bacterium]|nr:hypothetical protein [Candidatus Berkelbacteria bacterium]
MCGIAGFVGQGTEENLESMIDAIKYRGPDDRGFFFKNSVGLAQARLSIIDVSPAGHQPMGNEDGTIWLVFNGEIYNFRQLRLEIEKLNRHHFKSLTDTEVIIHLYEEVGETVFEKLHGMFAIALFDFKKNKLILARDRIGKKPLYWGVFNTTIIFGSELKAVLRHPLAKKEIDLNSLNKYLACEYVPTPFSIFKNIYKLEPGSYLVWQNNAARKVKFWQLDFSGESNRPFPEVVSTLGDKIERAVQQRLVADVPLGIFLSGGLDSSTIAYYAQKNCSRQIKTFSIGFEETSFDESRYANKISNFLGTEHHREILSSKAAQELIPVIGQLADEPLADASIIPTYFLSKFTRQLVTVALGGDGGDELFAGYPTFQAQQLREFYLKMPNFFRKNVVEKIINLLPTTDKNLSLEFKFKKFISGIDENIMHTHQLWLGSFNKLQRKQLLREDIWRELENKNVYEETDQYTREAAGGNINNTLLYVYLRTYLMDGVLVKVDRASMYNSLEIRSPFLDQAVVDFCFHLPYDYKQRLFRSKRILKELMADKLPIETVFRAKKGFGVPLARWLRGDLKNFCNEILSEDNIEKNGLFNFRYIDNLKQQHFTGRSNHRKLLWTLIMWQMWTENWYK